MLEFTYIQLLFFNINNETSQHAIQEKYFIKTAYLFTVAVYAEFRRTVVPNNNISINIASISVKLIRDKAHCKRYPVLKIPRKDLTNIRDGQLLNLQKVCIWSYQNFFETGTTWLNYKGCGRWRQTCLRHQKV